MTSPVLVCDVKRMFFLKFIILYSTYKYLLINSTHIIEPPLACPFLYFAYICCCIPKYRGVGTCPLESVHQKSVYTPKAHYVDFYFVNPLHLPILE